jgi:hypothetical protein
MRVCCQWRTGQCLVHQAEHQANSHSRVFLMTRSAIIHRTVRCAPDMFGEPTEQRSLCATVDCKSKQWSEQCAAEVRAEKSKCGTGLSSAATGWRLPTVDRSKPQWACWRGTHRTVNSAYPVHDRTVRCAHRQQTQPTARKWLEAINTPNHLLQLHPSFLNSTFIARAKQNTPRHIQSIQSTPSSQNQL